MTMAPTLKRSPWGDLVGLDSAALTEIEKRREEVLERVFNEGGLALPRVNPYTTPDGQSRLTVALEKSGEGTALTDDELIWNFVCAHPFPNPIRWGIMRHLNPHSHAVHSAIAHRRLEEYHYGTDPARQRAGEVGVCMMPIEWEAQDIRISNLVCKGVPANAWAPRAPKQGEYAEAWDA